MQPLDRFEELVAQARHETAPAVDVTSRVLESIQQCRSSPLADKPSMAIAVAAFVAASVAVSMAWQSSEVVRNPLVKVFSPPVYVMFQ